MRLSRKAKEEFRKIWQEEYGEFLMEREAEEIGTRLLLLFKTIYSKQYENEKPAYVIGFNTVQLSQLLGVS